MQDLSAYLCNFVASASIYSGVNMLKSCREMLLHPITKYLATSRPPVCIANRFHQVANILYKPPNSSTTTDSYNPDYDWFTIIISIQYGHKVVAQISVITNLYICKLENIYFLYSQVCTYQFHKVLFYLSLLTQL